MNTTRTEKKIIQDGMESLIKALGIVDAERFLVIMNRKKANYDEWRETFFSGMNHEEYRNELIEFSSKQ